MYYKAMQLTKWLLILIVAVSVTPHPLGTSFASDEGGGDKPVARISNNTTNKAVRILNEGRRECSVIDEVYKIDCLRQVFSRAASALDAPEYSGARRELRATSRALKKLVNSNVDKSKPGVKVKRRKLKAVKKAVVRNLNRQAKTIITESATKLLRSASKSKLRRSHYTKIAKAFDSTKVILRS